MDSMESRLISDSGPIYQTSHKVRIDYQITPAIYRIAAYLLDSAIKYILFFILYFLVIASVLGAMALPKKLLSRLNTPSLVSLMIIVCLYAVFYTFYNFIFEIAWKGQTPGKRVMHIRVVNDNGSYATALPLILRNLFRIVDFLPFFYLSGTVIMLLNKRRKRFGDLVAGTIVIKDEKKNLPEAPQEIDLDLFHSDPSIREKAIAVDLGLIRRYFDTRSGLNGPVRVQIEENLCSLITNKTGIARPENLDHKDFIGAFYSFAIKNSIRTVR